MRMAPFYLNLNQIEGGFMYREIEMMLSNGTTISMPFKGNAATPIRLKQVFHRDLWKLIGELDSTGDSALFENMDIVSELAYIMHCQGAGIDMTKINFDSYVQWLDTLDGGAIFENVTEIIQLYIDTSRSSSKAKKANALPPGA